MSARHIRLGAMLALTVIACSVLAGLWLRFGESVFMAALGTLIC